MTQAKLPSWIPPDAPEHLKQYMLREHGFASPEKRNQSFDKIRSVKNIWDLRIQTPKYRQSDQELLNWLNSQLSNSIKRLEDLIFYDAIPLNEL